MNLLEASQHFDLLPYRDIVAALAKNHTEIFIELIKDFPTSAPEMKAHAAIAAAQLLAHAKHARYLRAGTVVSAIKACREATGWGLKESKDFVEAQYDWYGKGFHWAPPPSRTT